jgi:hypothetical protein
METRDNHVKTLGIDTCDDNVTLQWCDAVKSYAGHEPDMKVCAGGMIVTVTDSEF